ncbi:hypothetical protein A5653_12535 [Mycobacterium colombiense]|uniref:hypothetical protein n=1 Tax=Mycobacterium colombiense TaxID=339268 RepID=UPI0007EFD789|nr:hypothetical protein [Mycobacterium colombiense]OBK69521.1 hypothetical protein A5653_12535 [Mycobacterium colombiense]
MADDDQPDDTEEQPDANTDEPEDHEPFVTPDDERQHGEPDEDAETFPRSYVEKLRKESQGYRERAKTAEANLDAALRELFTARVTASGRLADPDDLPYDAELLADEDKLTGAIDELIKRKPHLAARKISGSVGQGVTGTKDEPFSLLGRLKQSV